jgi:hypothetical protein
MARAYSMNLRNRVIEVCDQRQSATDVAVRYAVSESFIEKPKRHKETMPSPCPSTA